MLNRPALASLNHLLAQSGWANARLIKFSGKTARFHIAPFSFTCTIQIDGSLLNSDVSADATFIIPPALLPRLSLHEDEAFQQINCTGDPDLIEEILFIARHLRWDAAEDFSRVMGDIAAERLVQLASTGRHHLNDVVLNLAQAASEYWTEERPLLVKPAPIADFCQQVDRLDRHLTQLEQRLRPLSES